MQADLVHDILLLKHVLSGIHILNETCLILWKPKVASTFKKNYITVDIITHILTEASKMPVVSLLIKLIFVLGV
jgi:hypothetical protein